MGCKTTVQTLGLYRINERTIDKVADLMLLQYINSSLEVIYYGSFKKTEPFIRKGNHWELDISKARKVL